MDFTGAKTGEQTFIPGIRSVPKGKRGYATQNFSTSIVTLIDSRPNKYPAPQHAANAAGPYNVIFSTRDNKFVLGDQIL